MSRQFTVPWVESPLFSLGSAPADASLQQKVLARHYHDEGYLIVKGLLADFDFAPLIAYMLARKQHRIQDAWTESVDALSLAVHERVLDLLKFLYGREPIPFQTLNFVKGSGQMIHSDTVHFNSIPAKWMCGVWVALEDIGPDQGPLVYYPKSHLLPEYTFTDLGVDDEEDPYAVYEEFTAAYLASRQPEMFLAKRGDCLVWASNLLHGGAALTNPDATRYSQVTHYFFDGVIPYTPRLSNPVSGEYYVREQVTDMRTGADMPITFNGRRVFFQPVPSGEVQLVKIVIDGRVKASAYLRRYPDVRESGVDPFEHYATFGHQEGRVW